MAVTAPLCIPVEIRLVGKPLRYFRLAGGVSEMGFVFPRALPEEMDGLLSLRFHLPDAEEALVVEGRAEERRPESDPDNPSARDDDAPEKLAVRFHRLDEEARARIARYVESRVGEA